MTQDPAQKTVATYPAAITPAMIMRVVGVFLLLIGVPIFIVLSTALMATANDPSSAEMLLLDKIGSQIDHR